MALTQSVWSEKYVNGKLRLQCTVVSTTGETDAYTVKTPQSLDMSKPFTLFYSASATPDGQALPLDMWVGFDEDLALSGQGASVVSSNGGNFKQLMDDVVLAVTTKIYAFVIDPLQAVADVVTVAAIATGLKVKGVVGACCAFNLDGGSSLAAVTHTFTIIQDNGKVGSGIGSIA